MSNRTITHFELIALLACLMSLVGLSMDMMLPAFGDMAQDLAIENSNHTQYIVISFILGMVFGELVFGPLADAIGRKKIILIGLFIYAFGALIALWSNAFEILLFGRIIQGIGVAGPKIGTRALIRDLFVGAAMARIMSIIFGILILVPMLAPLLGQLVIQATNWRFLFIAFVVIALILAFWFTCRQAETLSADKRIIIAPKILAANSILILKHRHAMAYMLCAGLIFGAQLCYLALAHSLFVELYQVGDKFPLYFAIVALGAGLGFFANALFIKHFSLHKIVNLALLAIAILSAVFLIVSLFHQAILPFMAFMSYCFLVFLTLGIVFGNINALGMQHMGRVAGLAASIFASISSLVAVLISSLFGSFYNATSLPIILVFLSTSCAAYLLVRWAQKTPAKPV